MPDDGFWETQAEEAQKRTAEELRLLRGLESLLRWWGKGGLALENCWKDLDDQYLAALDRHREGE